MATKREKELLENLLEWKREGALEPVSKMYNREIADNLFLRELKPKIWILERVYKEVVDGQETIRREGLIMSHKTFISLGIEIMEAVGFTNKR